MVSHRTRGILMLPFVSVLLSLLMLAEAGPSGTRAHGGMAWTQSLTKSPAVVHTARTVVAGAMVHHPVTNPLASAHTIAVFASVAANDVATSVDGTRHEASLARVNSARAPPAID